MAKIVVGLDLGLKISAACWRQGGEGVPRSAVVEFGDERGMSAKQKVERVVAITDGLVRIVRASGAEVVAIEGYAYGTQGRAFDMAELGGAVRYAIFKELGITPIALQVKTARNIAFGKGSLKKTEVAKRVRRLVPKGALKTEDECDAYCMLRAAEIIMAAIESGQPAPKGSPLARAIEKVRD